MKLLFLCIANSARSQMAEGLAKKIFGPETMIQSAGAHPAFVHPKAIAVMKEVGIDISQQHSKSVNEIDPQTVDTVITLCAEEVCPVFLGGARRLHWPLSDPVRGWTTEEQLENFRRVRDEIKKRLEEFKKILLVSQ